MFRDKKEELRRLEEELLLEEQMEEEEAQSEEEEEEEELLDDEQDFGEETEETYYNYSNRYGQIRTYNSDRTDEDLDVFSEEVYEGNDRGGIGGLTLLAVFLLVAMVFVLGWFYLRFKGSL